MTVLDRYRELLDAQLGAIKANDVLTSKESTKVIRDLSKNIDKLSIDLRRELIEFDRSLTIGA